MKKTMRFIAKVTSVIIVILLCFAFAYQQEENEKKLTEEQAKAIIEGFMKFRNEGNLAAAVAFFHPDVVINYPNLPQPIKGLDAYKEYDKVMHATFSDLKITIDEFFVKDDKIYSYWTMTATNTGPLMTPMGEIPPTNKKVKISGMAVTHVVDGKIIEDVAYFDMLDMMMQLGFTLVPPQPQQP